MRFCVRCGIAFALVICHSSLHGQSLLIASSGFLISLNFSDVQFLGHLNPYALNRTYFRNNRSAFSCFCWNQALVAVFSHGSALKR